MQEETGHSKTSLPVHGSWDFTKLNPGKKISKHVGKITK